MVIWHGRRLFAVAIAFLMLLALSLFVQVIGSQALVTAHENGLVAVALLASATVLYPVAQR